MAADPARVPAPARGCRRPARPRPRNTRITHSNAWEPNPYATTQPTMELEAVNAGASSDRRVQRRYSELRRQEIFDFHTVAAFDDLRDPLAVAVRVIALV